MKAVINGGLNLSTLDGWWAEAYDQTNGWALSGEVDPDSSAQDARDAAALFDLLEQEVLPAFYDRDPDGLPRSWLDRIRASMRTLAPAFCAGRMLDDYLERIYAPTDPAPADGLTELKGRCGGVECEARRGRDSAGSRGRRGWSGARRGARRSDAARRRYDESATERRLARDRAR